MPGFHLLAPRFVLLALLIHLLVPVVGFLALAIHPLVPIIRCLALPIPRLAIRRDLLPPCVLLFAVVLFLLPGVAAGLDGSRHAEDGQKSSDANVSANVSHHGGSPGNSARGP